MRTEVRYPLQPVIDEAVSQARTTLAAQGLQGFAAASESTPPQLTTTAGEDEDGNTITLYPFLLGVDALGQSGPFLAVRGLPRKYFRR